MRSDTVMKSRLPFRFSGLFTGPRIYLFLLCGTGLTVLSILAWKLGLFIDEACSLDTTGRDWAYALSRSIYYELQPPLYFLLLHAWRYLGESVFTARLFSVLCYPFIIFAMFRLLPATLKGWPALMAATVFAAHPFLFWAALEIRLYSVLLLISLLLLWTFRSGYLEGNDRVAKVLHLALAAAALYTQYFSGFLLAAFGAVLVVQGRWKTLAHYIGGMALVALAFSPMVRIIPGQVSDHTGDPDGPLGFREGVLHLARRLEYLLLPHGASGPEVLTGWTSRQWFGRLLLVLCAWTLVRRRDIRRDPWMNCLIVVLLFTTLCFVLVYPITGPSNLSLRHTTILVGPLLLTVLGLVGGCGRTAAIVAMAGMLVLEGMALRAAYTPPAKPGDWKRVAHHVELRDKSWPVVTYPSWIELPLSYDYSGRGRLVPLTGRVYLERYFHPDHDLHQESIIAPRLADLGDTLWLAQTTPMAACPGCEILDRYVERNFTVLESKDFYRSRVRLLARRPGPSRPE